MSAQVLPCKFAHTHRHLRLDLSLLARYIFQGDVGKWVELRTKRVLQGVGMWCALANTAFPISNNLHWRSGFGAVSLDSLLAPRVFSRVLSGFDTQAPEREAHHHGL